MNQGFRDLGLEQVWGMYASLGDQSNCQASPVCEGSIQWAKRKCIRILEVIRVRVGRVDLLSPLVLPTPFQAQRCMMEVCTLHACPSRKKERKIIICLSDSEGKWKCVARAKGEPLEFWNASAPRGGENCHLLSWQGCIFSFCDTDLHLSKGWRSSAYFPYKL